MGYSPEHAFESRLRRRFEWAGYVAVKLARSKPFDLIVMKAGYVAALELKPLGRKIREDQRAMQVDVAKRAGINLILLTQFPKGRVKAENLFGGDLPARAMIMLKDVFGNLLLQ